MRKSSFLLFLHISVILMLCMSLSSGAVEEDRKVYIAYLGSLPDGDYSPSSHHFSILQSLLKQSSVENYITRSYRRSFNGFAAKLTDEEAKKLATESNVIIGVLDTGIWPESDSFSDEGFGPPPKKWKGSCNGGLNFTCNNKLIGARTYETDSARDTEGHGSHTASTAAGNIVGNANFFGLAEGTARGGVPSARIAAYKVCGADGFIRIGSIRFYSDPVAVGAYHAAEKGILVMQSAGNSGASGLQSVSSVAPWILSVAASTTDRLFIGNVVLGNGKTLTGFSVNSFSLNGTKVPLVYGLQASSGCDEASARACSDGCLSSTLVENKIVVCDNFRGLTEARRSGALGSILETLFDNVSFVVPFPASALSIEHFHSFESYLNSTEKAVAEILKSETIEDSTAPVVAAFSSRGPSVIPDISAPGVDILAAFSPVAAPSSTGIDERHVKYNIMSGTSMSCPHVAALAAYVKTFHPHWSPSAIKSALMTTASPMDPSKNPDAEFSYGSGHVNPVKAINPGLVYDNVEGESLRFLCSLGYDEEKIRAVTGTNVSCPKTSNKVLPRDFNYPTLSAQVKPGESFTVHFPRTVTNVGVATSTYNATIFSDSKLEIEVIPKILSFESLTEKKTYNVTVKGKALSEQSMVSGSLRWSDGIHMVRSPIVIHSYEGLSKAV
ncbi:putative Subtilisin serine endopeptidase family protein [Hibiscus syriacus]|uniref:Subtilisin serine endopeptidase family protein n=1 Tax=Hibiscus syriacus TaxID=106335 RepID=A0A6A3A0T4_HIBSY|nr:putative Subtilisin serine endopeptidase family protein [Hibiscus syriacus]